MVTAGQSDFCLSSDAWSLEPNPEAEFGASWWIHVRASDGLEGWVRPESLDWAD